MYNSRHGGTVASQHEKLQNSHEQAVNAANKGFVYCANRRNELGLGAGHRTHCSTAVREHLHVTSMQRSKMCNIRAPRHLSALDHHRQASDFTLALAYMDLLRLGLGSVFDFGLRYSIDCKGNACHHAASFFGVLP